MFCCINVRCLKLIKRSFQFSRHAIIMKKIYFDINCAVLLYYKISSNFSQINLEQ